MRGLHPDLAHVRGFLLDLDGTLYEGGASAHLLVPDATRPDFDGIPGDDELPIDLVIDSVAELLRE